METHLIIGYVLMSIGILGLIYCIYQLARNNKVYSIRIDWIFMEDNRRDRYTDKYMMHPKPHNWFGLRWPKEKHYKK